MSPETPKYKLVYYNVRALGEPIRWLFHFAGVPFIDERIPWDYVHWFANLKKDYASTVGQIPVLYENGQELCQSSSITRYLADQFGLLADTPWQRARGDEVISLIMDLFIAWRTNCFEKDEERRNAMKPVIDERFKLYYAKWNQVLSETEGDFIAGTKITHADFWLANFISIWDEPLTGESPILRPGMRQLEQPFFYLDLTLDYPLLRKHKEKVLAIPQIKEWVAKRPKTIC